MNPFDKIPPMIVGNRDGLTILPLDETREHRRTVYMRALGVVDRVFGYEFNAEGDKGSRTSTDEIRDAMNALILCAPSKIVGLYMACVMPSDKFHSDDLLALRDDMRVDLALEPLVYADPERAWLAARKKS